jgi:hypothetical protein
MTSPLWQTIHAEAVRLKHLDPVKMADSAVHMRERALLMKQNRRCTKLIDVKPRAPPPPVPMKKKAAIKCKAIAIGTNRQCACAAKMAGFCTKHFVELK